MLVDLGLARLSDNLLFVAVVCYALAMLGYAAEFAFRRRRSGEPVGRAAARGRVGRRLVGPRSWALLESATVWERRGRVAPGVELRGRGR